MFLRYVKDARTRINVGGGGGLDADGDSDKDDEKSDEDSVSDCLPTQQLAIRTRWKVLEYFLTEGCFLEVGAAVEVTQRG